jgi:hypothetical protein
LFDIYIGILLGAHPILHISKIRVNAEVNVFPADHGWKHIHLGINTETGGCGCSLKELLMMGTMVPKTC